MHLPIACLHNKYIWLLKHEYIMAESHVPDSAVRRTTWHKLLEWDILYEGKQGTQLMMRPMEIFKLMTCPGANVHKPRLRVQPWHTLQAICITKSFCESEIAFATFLSIGGEPLLSSGLTGKTTKEERIIFQRFFQMSVEIYKMNIPGLCAWGRYVTFETLAVNCQC